MSSRSKRFEPNEKHFWIRWTHLHQKVNRKANRKLTRPAKMESPAPAPPHPLIDIWRDIQEDLRKQVISHDTEDWQQNFPSKLKYVAGLDISTPKEQVPGVDITEAFTAITIYSYPDLTLVYQEVQAVTLNTPYAAGFLAFRESPAVCQLVQKVLTEHPDLTPDVLLVDGNGLLHPQRCGLACHIGLKLDIPTIGVAKNFLHIDRLPAPDKAELQKMNKTGNFVELRTDEGEILGMALKTSDASKNPVYVSVGHKISLVTARQVVLAMSKYRVPEPIRIADHISREAIASLQKDLQRLNLNQNDQPNLKT